MAETVSKIQQRWELANARLKAERVFTDLEHESHQRELNAQRREILRDFKIRRLQLNAHWAQRNSEISKKMAMLMQTESVNRHPVIRSESHAQLYDIETIL